MLKHSLLVVIFFISFMIQAKPVDNSNPYVLIEQVAANTFERIKKDSALIEKDKEHLRVVVAEELMPYIDHKQAARQVLDKHLQQVRKIKDREVRQVEVEKMRTFVKVFRQYLIATYANAFTEYDNQQVIFGPHKSFKGKKRVMVKAQIVEANRPAINLDFRLFKNKHNQWKAYDMLAEGISLLDAKKAELQGELRTKGIEHVTQRLEKKSKSPIGGTKQVKQSK